MDSGPQVFDVPRRGIYYGAKYRLVRYIHDLKRRNATMKNSWLSGVLYGSPCVVAGIMATVLCIATRPVTATIVAGAVTGGSSLEQGGKFVKLTVPFSDSEPNNTVGANTFQTPNLYGFDEGQNIPITMDLPVDILANGAGDGTAAGIIHKGSIVASHYIFFDPLRATKQKGTVSFDSKIIGVITKTRQLATSDFLINTGVTYLNPSARGLEANDRVSITGARTLTVDWVASSPGDYIRVLTALSPAALDKWFRLFELPNPFHK